MTMRCQLIKIVVLLHSRARIVTKEHGQLILGHITDQTIQDCLLLVIQVANEVERIVHANLPAGIHSNHIDLLSSRLQLDFVRVQLALSSHHRVVGVEVLVTVSAQHIQCVMIASDI